MATDGGTATVDGISAFDPVLGVYYYVLDFGNANIYSVNVQKEIVGETLDVQEAIYVQT